MCWAPTLLRIIFLSQGDFSKIQRQMNKTQFLAIKKMGSNKASLQSGCCDLVRQCVKAPSMAPESIGA